MLLRSDPLLKILLDIWFINIYSINGYNDIDGKHLRCWEDFSQDS